MKTLYILSFSLFALTTKSFSQCSAAINITPDGIGGYTFGAANLTDTTAFTNYYWQLSTDSLPFDSNTIETALSFDTNGAYSVCFSMRDTSNTSCVFDTCVELNVADAEYHALLSSINIWYFTPNLIPVITLPHHGSRTDNCFYPGYYDVYFTYRDTVLDGYAYKPLYGHYRQQPSCLFGFIREDTIERKVYFKDNGSKPEILLYDFSMKIGDTLSVSFYNGDWGYFAPGNYSLDSIKPYSTPKGIRNAYYLNCDTCTVGQHPTLSWVEGIGNLGHTIYPYSPNYGGGLFLSFCGQSSPSINPDDFPYGFYQVLICFEHAQRVYYDSCTLVNSIGNPCMNFIDSCNYGNICGAIDELSSLSAFTISPNPVSSGNAIVELDVRQSDNFSLVIQTLEGKNVSAENNLGWLQTGKHNVGLSVSNISSGFYLVGCKTDEGTLYRKLVVQRQE